MVLLKEGQGTEETVEGKGVPRTQGRSVERSRIWRDNPSDIPDKYYPTSAPPGTVEKLAVMRVRRVRKEPLFHPYDARYLGDPIVDMFRSLEWIEKLKLFRRFRKYIEDCGPCDFGDEGE